MEILKIVDQEKFTIKTITETKTDTEKFENIDALYQEIARLNRFGYRRISEVYPMITLSIGSSGVRFSYK